MANSIFVRLYSAVGEWIDHISIIIGPPRPSLDANQAARDLTKKYGESKYQLDDADTSSRLQLPDGRCVGFAQFGSPSGRPVFALHGLLGSRYDYATLGPAAKRLNVRLICPERPGIGWSTPAGKEYSLLDHARDIRRVADHLELKEYAVLVRSKPSPYKSSTHPKRLIIIPHIQGTSGGGPYALACAASAAQDPRLKAVTVACGVGTPDMGHKGMGWMHWMGFALGFRLLPGICKLFMKGDVLTRLDLPDDARMDALMRLRSRDRAHPREAEALRDVDAARCLLRSSREAHAQGFEGWARDGARVSSAWGFRIQDVPVVVPVSLWYGTADTNVPANHGEQIAARLGGRAEYHVVDETHGSLQLHWGETYLRNLVAKMS